MKNETLAAKKIELSIRKTIQLVEKLRKIDSEELKTLANRLEDMEYLGLGDLFPSLDNNLIYFKQVKPNDSKKLKAVFLQISDKSFDTLTTEGRRKYHSMVLECLGDRNILVASLSCLRLFRDSKDITNAERQKRLEIARKVNQRWKKMFEVTNPSIDAMIQENINNFSLPK